MSDQGKKISVSIDESHNYQDLQKLNSSKAFEIERKLISYILLGSGVSLISIMGFASNYPDPETYFSAMIISIWCLVIALTIASINLLIAGYSYDCWASYFNNMNNYQSWEKSKKKAQKATVGYENSLSEYEKIKKITEKQITSYSYEAEKYLKRAKACDIFMRISLVISFLAFLLAIVVPMVKISLQGSIYG